MSVTFFPQLKTAERFLTGHGFYPGHGSNALRQSPGVAARVVPDLWFRVPSYHSELIASFSAEDGFSVNVDRSCIPLPGRTRIAAVNGGMWQISGINSI